MDNSIDKEPIKDLIERLIKESNKESDGFNVEIRRIGRPVNIEKQIKYLEHKYNPKSQVFIERYQRFVNELPDYAEGEVSKQDFYSDMEKIMEEKNNGDDNDTNVFSQSYKTPRARLTTQYPVARYFIDIDGLFRYKKGGDTKALSLEEAMEIDGDNISDEAVSAFANQLKSIAKRFGNKNDIYSINRTYEIYKRLLSDYKRDDPNEEYFDQLISAVEHRIYNNKVNRKRKGLEESIKEGETLRTIFNYIGYIKAIRGQKAQGRFYYNGIRELINDIKEFKKLIKESRFNSTKKHYITFGGDIEEVIQKIQKINPEIDVEQTKTELIAKRVKGLVEMVVNEYLAQEPKRLYDLSDREFVESIGEEITDLLGKTDKVKIDGTLDLLLTTAKVNILLGIYHNKDLIRPEIRQDNLEKVQDIVYATAKSFAENGNEDGLEKIQDLVYNGAIQYAEIQNDIVVRVLLNTFEKISTDFKDILEEEEQDIKKAITAVESILKGK
jgi:Asp-tRNA(Asn)/Glu-tRNA(Gln) amidotransferase C subunit